MKRGVKSIQINGKEYNISNVGVDDKIDFDTGEFERSAFGKRILALDLDLKASKEDTEAWNVFIQEKLAKFEADNLSSLWALVHHLRI